MLFQRLNLRHIIIKIVAKNVLIREINVGCFFFPDDDDSKSQDKIEGERIKYTVTFNFTT